MKKLLICVVLLLVIFGLFLGFSSSSDEQKFVKTTVSKQDLKLSVNAVGKVYAKNLVSVATLANGEIKQMLIKQGDILKKGDIIAILDDVNERNALANAKAKLANLQDEISLANAEYNRADKLYKDAKRLYEKGAKSLNELLEKQVNLKSAKAKLSQAKAQQISAQNDIKTLTKNLDDTVVKSPIDGVAISVDATIGQTINSRLNSPVIAKIADISEFEIRIKIPQSEINKLKIGQEIKAKALASKKTFLSKLAIIDEADTSSVDGSNAGAVYYYARYFIAANEANNELKIGMDIENDIQIKNIKDALCLPINFIQQDASGYFVYQQSAQGLRKIPVKLGESDEFKVQILSGLKEGDEVVLNDQIS